MAVFVLNIQASANDSPHVSVISVATEFRDEQKQKKQADVRS